MSPLINPHTFQLMTWLKQMAALVCVCVSLWLPLSHSERHELDITPLREQDMHGLTSNAQKLPSSSSFLFTSPLSHSLPLLFLFLFYLQPCWWKHATHCRCEPQKVTSTVHSWLFTKRRSGWQMDRKVDSVRQTRCWNKRVIKFRKKKRMDVTEAETQTDRKRQT